MVLAVGRCASLTSLLLVLSAMSTLVRSQAPDDAMGSCTETAVPDGVFMLLDAGWYQTLLTGGTGSAGWTQTPAGSWEGKGSFCTRRLESSCDVSDAWVVTQYINKSAIVNYAMNISVAVEGDSSTSGTIKVHYFPSDGPITNNAQLNTANYEFIRGLPYTPSSEEKFVNFSLDSQYDRFYVAIEVESTCFTLRGLKVSYQTCQKNPEGLVVYPDAPVGTSAATISAKCTENAIVSSGSSLSVTCNTDGTYSGSPSCSCDGGHFESGESCQTCAANYSSMAGDGGCTKCPTNTHSQKGASECDCNANFYRAGFHDCPPCPDNSISSAASTECTCVAGYHRTSEEGPPDPCTTAPTKPTGLTNSSRTDTSVTLSWTAPSSNGGRDDLFYNVRYNILGSLVEKSITGITNNMVTVYGLNPVTTYVFAVVAGNGVTEEFSGTFPEGDRTSDEVMVMTTPSRPKILDCMVRGGNTLVWVLSTESLSDVTRYEVNITGAEKLRILDPNNFTYVPVIEDFNGSQNQSIELKVRGVNSGGVGNYSNKAYISYCAYNHLLNPPENCNINVDECPTSTSTPAVATSPTSNSTDDPLPISLEGYLLYTIAGVVAALYVVLIVILVVMCCYMKFRKKDYYITKTTNMFDTELISSAKV